MCLGILYEVHGGKQSYVFMYNRWLILSNVFCLKGVLNIKSKNI